MHDCVHFVASEPGVIMTRTVILGTKNIKGTSSPALAHSGKEGKLTETVVSELFLPSLLSAQSAARPEAPFAPQPSLQSLA